MKIDTKKLTALGVLAAFSIVLMLAVRIPFPPAPFLEYDPADIPILIGSFLFGPWWGIALTAAVSLLQGFTVSSGSGIIGIVMHFAATGSFSVLAGSIYSANKTKKSAYISLVLGVVIQTAVMVLMNIWLTPIYMETPREIVIEMIVPVILPFNLIKASINAIVTALVYKRIHNVFKKFKIA